MAFTKRALACSTLALTSVGVFGATTPTAHARTAADERQLINRTDGSRVAVLSDSLGEGAQIISLRSPGWQYKSVKWTYTSNADESIVIKNVYTNKCLQPSTAAPKAGDTIVVRTCDGSDAQNWTYRWEETGGASANWFSLRPKGSPGLAITLAVYQGSGSWNTLYLDRDQNSNDRLWRFLADGATW
ncbi:hypothetical protein Ssi03_57950 [Sphaerisporangium siamense]|uniref:Ricin B lectin domain-containing protein n=1 Tax=Sphaerisporangium siamense TaxID=795645 RepID=A0A7W7D6Q7_9ACTN|nr:RICIN domain-containing protein [Sphaerisporangium siamense]MBB4700385.1 hypothetical protein [Sphaerisporangium siamense]GII87805.1 hypothetical protein Ssi03_57950 [Sphaerisporangium siamense]